MIDERIARVAQEANSFSDYKEGSATAGYNSMVASFDKEVDELIEKYKSNYEQNADKIDYYRERYETKLAKAINEQNRIEAMCPSVMICGAGNFPMRKKQRQNEARDNFYKKSGWIFEDDNYYLKKIRTILTSSVIYSNDEFAIEKLENKIADAEAWQQTMKDVNAFYKKNKNLDECDLLNDEQKSKAKRNLEISWWGNIPYPSYELTNNNANIRRLKQRLDEMKKLKENANQNNDEKYAKVDGLKVVEDADEMRIKLLFDGVPSVEIRELLKSNGYRWSPKNKAWQRQLTSNGIYATKQVLKKLKEMEAVEQ